MLRRNGSVMKSAESVNDKDKDKDKVDDLALIR